MITVKDLKEILKNYSDEQTIFCLNMTNGEIIENFEVITAEEREAMNKGEKFYN